MLTGRGPPRKPHQPSKPPDAPAATPCCGHPFQTGQLSLPRFDAACFPRREAASKVDAQIGEEQAAHSGLSTGQGPSPGASEAPIDQAPRRRRPRRRGCAPPGPGQPGGARFFRYLVTVSFTPKLARDGARSTGTHAPGTEGVWVSKPDPRFL